MTANQAPALARATAVSPWRELEATRWLLATVAETLQSTVLPELGGLPAAHAGLCARVVARLAAQLGDTDDPGQPGLEAEIDRLETVERHVGHLLCAPASPRHAQPVDARRIEAYLRSHHRGGAQVEVVRADLLPGGRSKRTVRVRLRDASDLPDEVIIRQDLQSALTGTSVAAEYALLERLHRAGLAVARPLLLEPAPEPFGSPFMVVTAVRGHQAGDIFEPPADEKLALALAGQLGRLHAIDTDDLTKVPGLFERDRTTEQLAAQLAGIREVLRRYGERCPSVSGCLEWLEANVHRVSQARALVHGDIGFHNVLADGAELTAVLDWELAHLGHPARDLGYVRTAVETMTRWDAFVAAYRAAGGPAVDPFDVDFFTLFSGLWLYHYLVRAGGTRLAEGVRNIEYANAFAVFVPTLRLRLARELRAVLRRGSGGERSASLARLARDVVVSNDIP